MIAYATHAASARSGSRLARRELRAASRLIAHRRPPRDRSNLDDPPALKRPLELLALGVPGPGGRVGQRGERIRDARELARPRDPLPGLRPRLVRRLPATLPERRDVALTPRRALSYPSHWRRLDRHALSGGRAGGR